MEVMLVVAIGSVVSGTVAATCLAGALLSLHEKRARQDKLRQRIAVAARDADGLGAEHGAHLSSQGKPPRRLGALSMLGRIPLAARLQAEHQKKRAQRALKADIPRLFEVVALGMRVGLGFDQSFARYARGFSTPLAALCRERLEVWERGLVTREDALRLLAESIGLKEFDRFVSMTIRALEYGAPMAHLLYELAESARKAYRAERQELVAKAPVKMLLPTGALVLPAMLLLVIGPIVLDVTGRMV
ncbi:MAG: type II secretion system F family protein [Coriobacteriales bacterium]|jgi:tight adherence protein C|nr:type II secretion system F family protein [Coriobacteriales bacterium]